MVILGLADFKLKKKTLQKIGRHALSNGLNSFNILVFERLPSPAAHYVSDKTKEFQSLCNFISHGEGFVRVRHRGECSRHWCRHI